MKRVFISFALRYCGRKKIENSVESWRQFLGNDLSLLQPSDIYRDRAIAKMEQMPQRWRVACQSERPALSGTAVTVRGRRALVSNMRDLTPEDGCPH